MIKKKISKKREFSLENMQETKIDKKKVIKWSPEKTQGDFQQVGAALLECLVDNDTIFFQHNCRSSAIY